MVNTPDYQLVMISNSVKCSKPQLFFLPKLGNHLLL